MRDEDVKKEGIDRQKRRKDGKKESQWKERKGREERKTTWNRIEEKDTIEKLIRWTKIVKPESSGKRSESLTKRYSSLTERSESLTKVDVRSNNLIKKIIPIKNEANDNLLQEYI